MNERYENGFIWPLRNAKWSLHLPYEQLNRHHWWDTLINKNANIKKTLKKKYPEIRRTKFSISERKVCDCVSYCSMSSFAKTSVPTIIIFHGKCHVIRSKLSFRRLLLDVSKTIFAYFDAKGFRFWTSYVVYDNVYVIRVTKYPWLKLIKSCANDRTMSLFWITEN